MLVFDKASSRYFIDPHYLTILPFKRIWDEDKSSNKEIATARLMWIYHMYNPRSPYREYKQDTKSYEIVKDTFPRKFLQQKEKELVELIEEATRKNIDLPEGTEKIEIPKLRQYDPEQDSDMEEAISWYLSHLEKTPLWDAYNSYSAAMYNLSGIIADPESSANDIRIASQELDTLPRKRENMRQQAVKDEAMMLKVQGDKNIKRSERLPEERKRRVLNSG